MLAFIFSIVRKSSFQTGIIATGTEVSYNNWNKCSAFKYEIAKNVIIVTTYNI